MSNEKTPRELGEILAEQLDILRKPSVTADDVRVSEGVANIVGKIQKQAALEMVYSEARKTTVGIIPSLERK